MSSTQATLSLNDSGFYTLSLSMREDGVHIDKMLLITDTNYIPTGNGPVESPHQIITETAVAELSSHNIQYSYDDLYRLTGAVYAGDITAAYSYTYDSVGNMTAYTETINTETSHISRTFNAANQLISSGGTSHTATYTYDDNGNMLSTNRDNGDELEVTAYVYNQRNLLTSVNKTIGTGTTQPITDYIYDGSGDRIQQRIYTPSTPATIITYTNDIQGLTQMLVADDGTAITYNVHGLDLISQQAGAGDARLLLADGLGSVRQEMVGNTIKTTTTYEPYGKLLAQSGSSGTIYGYTGEQYDTATSLVYLRARYYNPHLKVFLSHDPYPGSYKRPASQHGYNYVNNNSINLTDPAGLCPETGDAACWSIYEQIERRFPSALHNPRIAASHGLPGIPLNEMNAFTLGGILSNLNTDPNFYFGYVSPDGVSLYISLDPIKKPVTMGPDGTGGIEILHNFHTGKKTIFAVGGIQAVFGAEASANCAVNTVFNIQDNNLKYSGSFVFWNLSAANGVGLTMGGAWTPMLRGNIVEYYSKNHNGSYSIGVGPVTGFGGDFRFGRVEYVPLVTFNEDLSVDEYHTKWYLYNNAERLYINDAIEIGIKTFKAFIPSELDPEHTPRIPTPPPH